MAFYDWDNTFSYMSSALLAVVCSNRGYGKTYGLRKKCVSQYLKHGYRFAELVRYKSELSTVSDGYFNKLVENGEFPDHVFKSDSKHLYIAAKPEGEDKPKWELCGYLSPMSCYQDEKKRTFSRVRTVFLDEGIIDKQLSPYKRYLPNEVDILINCMSTIFRRNPGRCFVLGNAVDLFNPYFQRYGVRKEPREGYTWLKGREVLLHYVNNEEYTEELRNSIAGRLAAGTREGDKIIENKFIESESFDIQGKTNRAVYMFGIVYQGRRMGVWLDDTEGYYYVTSRTVNDPTKPVFALTHDDGNANYIMARRANKSLRGFVDMYYSGIVRFDDASTRNTFMKAMQLFGLGR